ncbi:hypothetical protein G7Y79_00009g027340 [Physcia stellaris]|nr:hypothetical protein G7Y79_00009g027340 [Physcia stellaris]
MAKAPPNPQQRLRLPRRHQPDLVAHVRHDQHLRSLPPQLLRYPNPTDPLNGEAAALLMRDPKTYEAKVKEYVSKYANKDAVEEDGEGVESASEMSSVGGFSDEEDEDVAGQMEV